MAIALASAGYRTEARRIARFLLGLDLGAAARFYRDGSRSTAAARRAMPAAGSRRRARRSPPAVAPGDCASIGGRRSWRDRADYQEGDAGDYLGNAIASGASLEGFETRRGLVRDGRGSRSPGLDSAAAWAVRPFARPALYPAVRRTLLHLVAARGTRFGLLPSEGWHGGDDPWTAPTAWTAWSLAALWRIDRRAGRQREAAVDRRAALGLIADLRRAATPLGLLPERVDAQTGAPALDHARSPGPTPSRSSLFARYGLKRGADRQLRRLDRDDSRAALHLLAAGDAHRCS